MPGKSARFIAISVLLTLAAASHAGSINKSVKIEAGTSADGASSVNGSVTVGEGATVTGDVETVNGTLKISDNVQARSLSTVNGSVTVGAGTIVEQGMEAVNGKLSLEPGASVGGSVENVNGEIAIDGASVGGDISTVNGDVELTNGAHVMGDIRIEKPGGWGWNKKKRKPKITLGQNARVDGSIIAEREVEIFVHDTAELGGVSGKASMEDVIRFSGNKP